MFGVLCIVRRKCSCDYRRWFIEILIRYNSDYLDEVGSDGNDNFASVRRIICMKLSALSLE